MYHLFVIANMSSNLASTGVRSDVTVFGWDIFQSRLMGPTVARRYVLCVRRTVCGDLASPHTLSSSCYSATTEGPAILLPRLPHPAQLI